MHRFIICRRKNKGTKSGKVLAIDYLKRNIKKLPIYSESENKRFSIL